DGQRGVDVAVEAARLHLAHVGDLVRRLGESEEHPIGVGRDAALTDPRALHNPLVARRHAAGEEMIVDDAFGHGHARARDAGPHGHQRPRNLGARFSRKARTPSAWSSVLMALDWPKASPSRAAARSTVAARLRSDLVRVAATGGPAAILPASPRVVASSSAASMMSPVSTISLALARPTRRCRSHVPPPSGTRPILMKTSPNFARSEAMIMSQPSAMLQPAPTANPSTMAMV